MMIKILLPLLMLLSSCSNYISSWHQRFDSNNPKVQAERQDTFKQFRKERRNMMSSNRRKTYMPETRRQYRAKRKMVKRRVKANDLNDNAGNNSLWVNEDSGNLLFSDANKKNIGDIVVINVQEELKKDITRELKAAFPDPLAKFTKKDGEEAKSVQNADGNAQAPVPGAEQGKLDSDSKIYDKVSSVVIEEIDNVHLLLRGRKQLIYKGQKRTVELQIMVPRREIMNEVINSDAIVEQSITVLR